MSEQQHGDEVALLPRLDSNQQPSGYALGLVSGTDPHHFACPHCGERVAAGADQCPRCWRPVGGVKAGLTPDRRPGDRRHLVLVGAA